MLCELSSQSRCRLAAHHFQCEDDKMWSWFLEGGRGEPERRRDTRGPGQFYSSSGTWMTWPAYNFGHWLSKSDRILHKARLHFFWCAAAVAFVPFPLVGSFCLSLPPSGIILFPPSSPLQATTTCMKLKSLSIHCGAQTRLISVNHPVLQPSRCYPISCWDLGHPEVFRHLIDLIYIRTRAH